VALAAAPLRTQTPQNPPAALYAQYCAACHGPKLEGGAASSLLDDDWKFGGDDASVTVSIRDGRAGTAMMPFKDILSAEQIRMLVFHIRE
jgi:mono/diheme cytochrome c family protein